MIDLNRLKDQFYIKKDQFKSILIENRLILYQIRDRRLDLNRWNPNQRNSTIDIDCLGMGSVYLDFYHLTLQNLKTK